MKTIDVLVEELPKRGGWPDGAIGAGFLSGEGALYFWDKNNDCPTKWTIDTDIEVEDSDEGVSREQYEAALAASKRCDHKWIPSEGRTQSGYLCSKCGNYDGPGYDWIDWPGGECPVPRGTLVDVKYLCGDVNRHIKAGDPDSSGSIDTAFAVRWSKLGAEYDIIAYRLHQPQEAEQAKADDEADLNECIGQDSAPVWSGDGAIPPVGCVCERSWAGDEWRPCEILFASNQIVVVKLKESSIEDAYNVGDVAFRPVRSEEDEKRDDRASAIDGFISGFRGQETGSNKELAYALTDYLALLDKL